MKKIILLFTLLFTITTSAQYTILSAVQLNDGAEDSYLKLEEFFGPVHDLAVDKGIEDLQAVFKVISESEDENAPHYIIISNFSSKEQLDAYNKSWADGDWLGLAKEAYKGKMSSRAVTRFLNGLGNESKDRRNYHLVGVDATIWSGGDLMPGERMVITPTQALNDDFESYETEFWKPYVEKSIIKGTHRYWGLSEVYEKSETAYDGISHFFFNVMVEGGSMTDGIPNDSFKFQKLQEGLNASSQHADPITIELVSLHN